MGEVQKMWGERTEFIPVVMGALGLVPLRLNDSLEAIQVGFPVELIKRCAFLGFAKGFSWLPKEPFCFLEPMKKPASTSPITLLINTNNNNNNNNNNLTLTLPLLNSLHTHT